jgi:hypothetical protein
MNLNFLSAIFTIISGVTSIIALYGVYIAYKGYKKQSAIESNRQEQSNIILPEGLRRSRLLKAKGRRVSIVTAISIIAIIVCIVSGVVFASQFFPPKNSTPTSTNTTFPTPVRTNWQTILTQTTPDCSKSNEAAWYVIPEATHYSCNASGLIMWQEQPPSPSIYNAEIDLEKVHGRYYDQTKFRLQVQVSFLTPSYPSTFATLGFQTPVKRGVSGGYTLALKPSGECYLQFVPVGSASANLVEGPNFLKINLHQPITMTVVVQNTMLWGYINDKIIFFHNESTDALSTAPLEVGLGVGQLHTLQSSKVQFSNFKLEVANLNLFSVI